MFQIDLIRHGRTKGNEEHRYVGITDEGLSPAGRQEVFKIREHLNNENHERRESDLRDEKQVCDGNVLHVSGACQNAFSEIIFRSPLRRCRESADILFPGIPQTVISEFRETDFGAFEYHTYEELKDNAAYRAWIASGGQTGCPGGESAGQVKERIQIGWEILCQAIEEIMSDDDGAVPSCALLAHGGTIMELLSLYGEPKKAYYDWQVSCGHGYRCLWDNKTKRLLVQDVWPPASERKEEKQKL